MPLSRPAQGLVPLCPRTALVVLYASIKNSDVSFLTCFTQAGALGKGQQTAFSIRTFNNFWFYVTPFIGKPRLILLSYPL